MALTSSKIVSARGGAAAVAALVNAAVAAEIVLGNSPVGQPQVNLFSSYPEIFDVSQSIAVGIATVTAYKLLTAKTLAALVTTTNTEITGGAAFLGGHVAFPSSQNTSHATYFQTTYKGQAADAGLGGVTGGPIAIAGVTGLQAALDALVPKTTTVNGHALSANVVVSGTDISTGTVPIAQLPVATNVAKGIASFGSGTTVTAGAVTVP